MFFLQKRKAISFLLFCVVLGFFAFYFSDTAYAQLSDVVAQQNVAQNQRAQLEKELAELEKEIAEKQAVLDGQKQKSASLTRDISILKTKIDKAKLDIKAQNLIIQKLSGQIIQKNKVIETLSEKINKGIGSISQLIRKTNEIDQNTIAEVILASQTISDFYSDFDSFSSINKALKISVDEIRLDKKQTEKEKKDLQVKQDAEIDAKKKIEDIQIQVEKNQKEQKKLLSISKDKEKEYQKVLAERAKKAAEIRVALFSLRDATAIPFGKALEYATYASQKTGVRPALILAILTQESNLGSNTGSCFLTDLLTGAGVHAKTGTSFSKVMSPKRDVPKFQEILSALGGDIYKVKVSCPIASAGGWGGAMGPSQFIPSTWISYKNKLAETLGISGMPDPWDPRQAITATALYLTSMGANTQTYTAERSAACKYYTGPGVGCSSRSGANYGNQVMAKAKSIQENMIDPLNEV